METARQQNIEPTYPNFKNKNIIFASFDLDIFSYTLKRIEENGAHLSRLNSCNEVRDFDLNSTDLLIMTAVLGDRGLGTEEGLHVPGLVLLAEIRRDFPNLPVVVVNSVLESEGEQFEMLGASVVEIPDMSEEILNTASALLVG